MVTWRNRSIDSLTASELRRALDDAINEITFSRASTNSTSFFSALMLGFSAGALVAATAAFTFVLMH
ncbi:MAG TPA: hypothetical protein VNR51_09935 [Hyphomicrobium sp.]|nr:hypothetical protein [Hyphomicrobium sp.]